MGNLEKKKMKYSMANNIKVNLFLYWCDYIYFFVSLEETNTWCPSKSTGWSFGNIIWIRVTQESCA